MRIAIASVVIALAAGSAAADVSIMDNNKKIDVDCAKDPEVDILGNHITVTMTGLCTKLSVSGNHAIVTGSALTVDVSGNESTVTLDAADFVTVDGNQNIVVVKKAAKAKKARVSVTGNKNKVSTPK